MAWKVVRCLVIAALVANAATIQASAQGSSAQGSSAQGIGQAYVAEVAADSWCRIAIGPNVAVENLIVVIANLADATNERRIRELGRTSGQLTAAVRREVTAFERPERRQAMRLLDPRSFQAVWPRSTLADELEEELFVRRRARVALPVELDSLTRAGALLWGSTSARNHGLSPCGEQVAALRAYGLLALERVDESGCVPRLLRALGEESTAQNRPGTRQVLWLEMLRNWPLARQRAPRGLPRNTLFANADVFVYGSKAQWQALLDACDSLREASRELWRWDAARGGALSRFFDPMSAEIARNEVFARIGLLAEGSPDAAGLRGPLAQDEARTFAVVLSDWAQLASIKDERALAIAFVQRREVRSGDKPVIAFELAPAAAGLIGRQSRDRDLRPGSVSR